MNTQWRKIRGDFRARWLQLCTIGIVLALGGAAVIAALNARAILEREIARSFRSANNPDVVLSFEKVDARLLELVRAQSGVIAVDARRVAYTRVAGRDGKWFLMRLVIAPLSAQQLGVVHEHESTWPTLDGGIFIEQSGRSLLHVSPNDSLQIRMPAGDIAALPLRGFVHDTTVAPSLQDRMIYGYVTPATAAAIGQSGELDQLLVKIADRRGFGDAAAFANDLRDWLQPKGANPLRAEALSDEHPHAVLMATMLRVLRVFAAIAFICSAALSLGMIALWMKREVRQVGIMKTIGARSHQLAAHYFGLVFPIVLAANLLAFPLGGWLGRELVRYYQMSFNIDVAQWNAPRALVGWELLFTLGIPLLAMMLPIVRAARTTARAAIQDPGILAPVRAQRWLKIPGNRRWTFALRNTFRRPWRLALTLVALSAGGALLLTANDTYESLMRVVDVSLGAQAHDLQIQLQRPAPAADLEDVALQIPEIAIAESWRSAGVSANRKGVAGSQRILLLNYPDESQLFQLPLKAGVLPSAEETDAVVINRLVQKEIPGLDVGDVLEMNFRNRRSTARVVGIVKEIGTPTIYAASPSFETITNLGDSASILRVKIKPGADESAVAAALDQALLAAHLAPAGVQTRGEFRASLEEHFAVVTDVMRMIALAAALLGAISLAASVSLNVLERAREIGVIRALGARPRAVRAVFLLEAGAVALLSAIIALAASIFLARAMNGMAARDLLHVAVPLQVSLSGLTTLLAGVLVVLLAVWLTLRRMLRLSVRDALAYE